MDQPNITLTPVNLETPASTSPATPPASLTPQVPSTAPKKTRGFVWGVILTFILVGAASAAAWKVGIIEIVQEASPLPTLPTAETAATAWPTSTPLYSPLPTAAAISTKAYISDITWLAQPKAIASLALFKPQKELTPYLDYYSTDSVKYFQLGETANKTKIIKAVIPMEGPVGNLNIRCVVHADGKTECLKEGLDQWTVETLPQLLKTSVPISDTTIEGLEAPTTLSVNTVQLKKNIGVNLDFPELNNAALIGETQYGRVYKNINRIGDEAVGTRSIYLRLKDDSLVAYYLAEGPLNNERANAVKLTFMNATKDMSNFTQAIFSGCGSASIGSVPVYTDSERLDSQVTEVGTFSTGQTIDALTDASNPLMEYMYHFYSLGVTDASAKLTLEAFAQKDAVVLWKDPLGDWEVFLDQTYAPAVECGKPVIYLYPQHNMPVSVKVGAAIRKSEPRYPAGGWRVIAQPDGTLVTGNNTYPYLFWEGTGNGRYPDYRNRGVVVSQDTVVATLYQQLQQLGLTAKEQADFMTFWQPRLPQSPFVRLTWLETRDMDELAPLTVTPKPDTTIRIFLEFEGLQQYQALTPQRLVAPARTGFTLIEWGGLLIGQ